MKTKVGRLKVMQEGAALTVIISGRVQKVGFRNFILHTAMELGVKGYVKNQEDRTVLVHVIGTPAQLDQMLEWCQKGPPLAKVSRIEVTPVNSKDYKDFKII